MVYLCCFETYFVVAVVFAWATHVVVVAGPTYIFTTTDLGSTKYFSLVTCAFSKEGQPLKVLGGESCTIFLHKRE